MYAIGEFFVKFLSGNDLLGVMQYISIAFLTVMIPLGIASLDKDKVLERYVFLDHIINIKLFGWSLLGLTTPLLFWGYARSVSSSMATKNLELYGLFLIWLISLVFFFNTFIKIYQWLKKKDIKQYLGYFKSLKNKEDILVIWGEVWKAKNENWINEKKYFSIFAKNINDFIKKGDIHAVIEALHTFEQFLEKRNLFFLTGPPDVFPKILEWHYEAWNFQYGFLIENEEEKKNYSDYGDYSELSRVLDSIIEKIENRVLTEGDSYIFFDHLRKHTEKYKDARKQKEIHVYYYLEQLHLQRPFFEGINKSKEAYDIENHYFPSDWKISVENIKKDNLIYKIWHNRFMDWSRDRIDNPKEEYDDHLDRVIGVILPNIHTIFFPYILTFVVRSWIDNRRMESLIDNPPHFGGYYYYPLLDASDKSEVDLDREREKNWEESRDYTIQLSVLLFRTSFTSIETSIGELKGLALKYRNDDEKERLRKKLLDIFERINKEILDRTMVRK